MLIHKQATNVRVTTNPRYVAEYRAPFIFTGLATQPEPIKSNTGHYERWAALPGCIFSASPDLDMSVAGLDVSVAGAKSIILTATLASSAPGLIFKTTSPTPNFMPTSGFYNPKDLALHKKMARYVNASLVSGLSNLPASQFLCIAITCPDAFDIYNVFGFSGHLFAIHIYAGELSAAEITEYYATI